MAAFNKHMKDLYRRLRERGFDPKFVREVILPDWWEDSLAEVPANRAMAESAIARHLNLEIGLLRDPSAVLPMAPVAHLRFKKRKNTSPDALAPSVLIAQRVARVILDGMETESAFVGSANAITLRHSIVSQGQVVNLEALLDLAWRSGIVVLHVTRLPGRKFDGMAFFIDATPVIVLASRRTGPPWLAYHLAHELGHVFCGHVAPGDDPLVDSEIASTEDDVQEQEADLFAMRLLTGRDSLDIPAIYGLNGEKLAARARTIAPQHGIDPGTLSLIYGNSSGRMGVGENALKALGMDDGAHHQVASALIRHLNLESIPESCQHLVESMALDPELVEELIEG